MPTVSLCIPTYNYARLLPRALESALSQTYGDFELILVDDCSTDATRDVVKAITDKRFRAVQNPKNVGVTANYNRCIEEACGKYICIFDADEWLEKTCLETFVAVLDRHPTAGMVFSSFYRHTEKQKTELRQHYPHDQFFKGEDFFAVNIRENIVATPAVMVRRGCFQKLGPFDTRLRSMFDWEMWLRIASFYDVAYVAKPLGHGSIHGENFSTVDLTEDRRFNEESLVLKKVFESLPEEKGHLFPLYKEARFISARRLYGCALVEMIYGHSLEKTGQGDTRLFRKQARLAIKMSPAIMIKTLVLVKMALSYCGLFPINFLRKIKNKLIKLFTTALASVVQVAYNILKRNGKLRETK